MSWKKLVENRKKYSVGGRVHELLPASIDPAQKYIKPIIEPESVDAPDESLLEAEELPTEDSEEVLRAGRLAAINAKKRKGRASTIMSGALGDSGAQGGRTILG